jgi:hypothetical protein
MATKAKQSWEAEKFPDDDGIDEKDREAYEFALKEEAKEHSWLDASQVKRLVKDHLSMDPEYYEDEMGGEKEDASEKEKD